MDKKPRRWADIDRAVAFLAISPTRCTPRPGRETVRLRPSSDTRPCAAYLLFNARVSSPGQDGDDDTGRAGVAQGPGSFAGGAAGGQHVVDEEDGFSLKFAVRPGEERAADVGLPLAGVLDGLSRRVANAAQPTRPARPTPFR